MIRPIVQLGDPVLRQTAKRVHHLDGSVHRLIDDMIESMHDASGVGLAAPQIGVPLRVIVTNVDEELKVLINPEILSTSSETDISEEGCLSIKGYSGPVERALSCEVRAMNEKGKKTKVRAEGWLSRCLQHEIDHLNGILYIDRVKDKSTIHRVDEDFEVESAEQRSDARSENEIPETADSTAS